jgi:PAS domain S-box-containing protein
LRSRDTLQQAAQRVVFESEAREDNVRRAPLEYAVALVAVVAAGVLRALLDPWLGNDVPFITMFGAVAAAAWFGGYGPAATTAVVGYLICAYFFIEPRGSFALLQIGSYISLVLYGLTSGVIIAFAEGMRHGERAAAEGRERLRVTFGSIGDAVITTDAVGHVMLLNSVAEKMTGWSNSEAAGQPLPVVFHIINELSRQVVEDPVAKVFASGTIVGLANHTVLIAKDGTELPIDDSAAPIRDRQGQLLGCVLVFRDVTQRRHLEKEATERLRTARLLAAIVESSDDAIASKSLDGMIQTWNSGAERVFGYSAAEAIGRHISLVIPRERISEEDEIVSLLKAGERVEHFETVRVRKDGRKIDVSLTISPIKDETGKVIGASKIARDITEKRRAEEALKQAERSATEDRERLRVTFASIGDAVIATDGEGRVVLMNPVAEKMTGWSNTEAAGQPLPVVFHIINEFSRQVVEDPVAKVFTSGAIVGLANHTVLIAKDGTELPIDDSAAPIRDARGHLRGCVLVFRDVTQRRRLEKEAAERLRTARLLASIIESSDDAIISKSLDGVIQSWNSGAEQIFGYSAAEAIGQHISLVIPPERIAEEDEIVKRLQAGGRVVHFETVRVCKDGRKLDVSLTVSPTKDETGKVIGASKIARDITDRKRAEAALLEADRRKDEFLATLAHELRNPLAPILNSVAVLKAPAATETDQWELRNVIERQVQHMSRLLDDLLDVNRITTGKFELRKARVALAAVMEAALETSRPLIEAGGHELTVSKPPEPIDLHADLVRLAQVFGNLLNNAAKYTDRGGHIWFSAERQGDDVVVSVRDNGIGISHEALPRIFDMFSQASPALQRSQGGLGIGLSLVQGLVELHGGSVTAKSDGPGRGSEFRVRLPIGVGSAAAGTHGNTNGGGKSAPKHRILIVDDLRDSADSLARLMRLQGQEVQTAYDGEQAIQAAEAMRPDVVLLDIGMPKVNGYDVCRHIRQQPWGRGTLLIAITGWGQEEDRRRTEAAGFDHHLVKPVDPAALLRVLAGAK